MGKIDYAVIAGDIQNFIKELNKIESENVIIAKHISTQMIEVENPNYMQGITLNQKKTIAAVFISAFIEFERKEEEVKNTLN